MSYDKINISLINKIIHLKKLFNCVFQTYYLKKPILNNFNILQINKHLLCSFM